MRAADVICTVLDPGVIEYEACWKLQQTLFDEVMAAKQAGNPAAYLILCEHPHVYTLGRSGHAENLLVDDGFLERIGATCVRTDRGGDITYHGPGQLVGYPILDLEALGMGLKVYIHTLEQAVIETLAGFGIAAGRSEGATGVWLENPARKICAIGVRSSHFVTMHGFALNVNTQLEYFAHINPCGFTDRGVTSMERELGRRVDMEAVKAAYLEKFGKIMNIKINKNDYAYHKTLGGEAAGRPRDGS